MEVGREEIGGKVKRGDVEGKEKCWERGLGGKVNQANK